MLVGGSALEESETWSTPHGCVFYTKATSERHRGCGLTGSRSVTMKTLCAAVVWQRSRGTDDRALKAAMSSCPCVERTNNLLQRNQKIFIMSLDSTVVVKIRWSDRQTESEKF